MARKNRILLAVLWVLSLLGAALVVYLFKGTTVTVLTGTATVGIDQAAAFADGGQYDLPVVDAVWKHADGSWQYGGHPACLPNEHHGLPVTFGYVSVNGPDGQAWNQVVWVSCAG